MFSFCFIGQVLLLYINAYMLKTSSMWKSGEAVYYALSLPNFRNPWATLLLEYPMLTKILNYITLYMFEAGVSVLFLCFAHYWKIRTLIIFAMVFFHLNLGLFIWLGLFSWITSIIWLTLLPSEFWDTLSLFLKRKQSQIHLYYDEHCTFCIKSLSLIKSFFILPFVRFKKSSSSKTSHFTYEVAWFLACVQSNHTILAGQMVSSMLSPFCFSFMFFIKPFA